MLREGNEILTMINIFIIFDFFIKILSNITYPGFIEKCLYDDDNEIRERAFMYSKALNAVKEDKKEENQ